MNQKNNNKEKTNIDLYDELRSIKRGIYYLISLSNKRKGTGKEYQNLRKLGFNDSEISLMFNVSETGIRSAISQLKK